MRVKALNGSQPHPDYGGWWKFLTKHCELRDQARGVRYYGASNCNYILFPCGTLIENYGYHGRVLMQQIRKEGRVKVLRTITEDYQTWKQAYDALCNSLGRLTKSLENARERQQQMLAVRQLSKARAG